MEIPFTFSLYLFTFPNEHLGQKFEIWEKIHGLLLRITSNLIEEKSSIVSFDDLELRWQELNSKERNINIIKIKLYCLYRVLYRILDTER